MAPRTGTLQALSKMAVLSFHARRIANEIYRLDKKDVTAELQQQPALVQDEYERLGTIVALQGDADAMRPALYAAADAMVQGGVGSLTPMQRAEAVALFARGLQAMKRHLGNSSHADHADLMHSLAEADQQAGIDRQQVVTGSKAVAFDLSAAATPGRVF